MNKKRISAALALTLLAGSVIPSLSSAAATQNAKVNWLVDQKWVVGRDGGDLALDASIQRAEFVKMVLASRGLLGEAEAKKDTDSKFKDVAKDHWANGIINLAAEKGLVKGDENGNFRPEDKISYNEILTILARLNSNFKEVATEGANWADQYVTFAKNNGYLKDVKVEDKDFATEATREKTFEIIYNYYHAVKPSNANPEITDNTNDFVWPIWRILDSSSSSRNLVVDRPSVTTPTTTKHQVTLIDGNDKNSIVVDHNTFVNLKSLYKDGYRFIGWMDKDGAIYSGRIQITKDIELRPYFEKTTVISANTQNLRDALNRASKVNYATYTSKDGTDVDPKDTWVKKEVQAELGDAINNANSILAKPDARQADVDNATIRLNRAIDNYKPQPGTKKEQEVKVDKTRLENAINNAKKIVKATTTSIDGKDINPADTWVTPLAQNNFDTQLSQAEQVLSNPSATQEQVDNVTLSLENAVKNYSPKKGLKEIKKLQLVIDQTQTIESIGLLGYRVIYEDGVKFKYYNWEDGKYTPYGVRGAQKPEELFLDINTDWLIIQDNEEKIMIEIYGNDYLSKDAKPIAVFSDITIDELPRP